MGFKLIKILEQLLNDKNKYEYMNSNQEKSYLFLYNVLVKFCNNKTKHYNGDKERGTDEFVMKQFFEMVENYSTYFWREEDGFSRKNLNRAINWLREEMNNID